MSIQAAGDWQWEHPAFSLRPITVFGVFFVPPLSDWLKKNVLEAIFEILCLNTEIESLRQDYLILK